MRGMMKVKIHASDFRARCKENHTYMCQTSAMFGVSKNSNYRNTGEVKLFSKASVLSMGKQGDVSFVLVVLVALACALAALGVMVQAVLEEQQKAEQFDALLSELEFQQAYALAETQSLTRAVIAEGVGNERLEERFREHASLREQKRAIAGTHGVYAAFQRGESGRFITTERGYVLEVRGIVIEAREGQSSITRVLDVRAEMRSDGTVERTMIVKG